MITHDEFQKALKIVNEYKIQIENLSKEVSKEVNSISKFANVNAKMKFGDVDISETLRNILNANDTKFGINLEFQTKISELSKISIRKFILCRNAGKIRLKELKELCFYAGISLQP